MSKLKLKSWFLVKDLKQPGIIYSVKEMTSSATERVIEVKVLVLVDDYSEFTKLLGEHGFSALITARYEGRREYSVLLDTGESGRVLVENASRLNVDLSRVDVLTLSHRHHDHSGGLPNITEFLSSKPLVAHPAITKP